MKAYWDLQSASRAQQRLDRTALVHREICLSHFVERQGKVKHFSRIDLSVPHQPNQFGQIATYGGGTTMEVNVPVKQLLTIELDPVRNADVAHVAATAGRLDRLHHGLPCTDTLQYRVSTDPVGQLFNALHACFTVTTKCFPNLTTAQVYECLAYYEDHRGEIDLLVACQMARAFTSSRHEFDCR